MIFGRYRVEGKTARPGSYLVALFASPKVKNFLYLPIKELTATGVPSRERNWGHNE